MKSKDLYCCNRIQKIQIVAIEFIYAVARADTVPQYRSEADLMKAADHNLLTSTETTSHKISVKD